VTCFVDTAGLVAILDDDDRWHDAAVLTWTQLVNGDEPLVTTNYVVVESWVVVQRRIGFDGLRTLKNDLLPLVDVLWVNQETHAAAENLLLASNRRQLSLVDCASFEAMRRHGIRRVFSIDPHFAEQGFDALPGGRTETGPPA
jgi:predicted nucleic acid-binding protein